VSLRAGPLADPSSVHGPGGGSANR
jgi:hypothetical protein